VPRTTTPARRISETILALFGEQGRKQRKVSRCVKTSPVRSASSDCSSVLFCSSLCWDGALVWWFLSHVSRPPLVDRHAASKVFWQTLPNRDELFYALCRAAEQRDEFAASGFRSLLGLAELQHGDVGQSACG
jgi:hypothetical protein